MTASCPRRWAPLCRPESHFSSWCSFGILLGALVLPLPVSPSDACGDPLRYESMKLKGVAQPHYSPGATVEYECRLGYKLKRPPLPTSARCQADNTWTPLREACTRKSCPHPGDPINGKVEYVNGTLTFGSQIHYFCNEGFNLIGTKILYCELVGETVNWSDNPPLCQVMYCRPPPKIQNGKHSRSDQEEFRYVVKCEPPVLENGRVVSGFGKKFYYKATVVFDCLPGFYLSGNNTIVCGANSAWEPAIPTCIKGTKPAVTTKPPRVSSSPGHPSCSFESPLLQNMKTLGGGIVAVIVVTEETEKGNSSGSTLYSGEVDPASSEPSLAASLK
nr:PREDICTED: membrane cofactor protein-like isoform X4 [Equus przewalskii]